MKEQQTAPLTTEELTEKYHKLRRTFILATVISIFGTIVMLPSVLFFKIPYALAGALVLPWSPSCHLNTSAPTPP